MITWFLNLDTINSDNRAKKRQDKTYEKACKSRIKARKIHAVAVKYEVSMNT